MIKCKRERRLLGASTGKKDAWEGKPMETMGG
jgi:hypothetical protein